MIGNLILGESSSNQEITLAKLSQKIGNISKSLRVGRGKSKSVKWLIGTRVTCQKCVKSIENLKENGDIPPAAEGNWRAIR